MTTLIPGARTAVSLSLSCWIRLIVEPAQCGSSLSEPSCLPHIAQ